ncbi:MAG: hypothetical protein JEY99_16980 [Spirochaetales bacterium]|nr:hypothetical protein [Spirochaetales bacterium]
MKNTLLIRLLIFTAGLFIMAFGVALSVKANLGISPVSCIPYIFSLKYPLTIGALTIIFNIVLILLQIILLRKRYQPFQLFQLLVALVFGFFIDFTMYLLSGVTVPGYTGRLAFCLLSCFLMGLAVFIEVKARLIYLPGEGLALAISETFPIDFGKAKVGADCTMVAVGIISSFVLLHHLKGIREGTILAALMIGSIAKFLKKKILFFDKVLA